jgi:hypothetical protein
MGRLRSSVHDQVRPDLADKRENSRPVPHVKLVMDKPRDQPRQAGLVPAGITLRSEKHRALIVIQTVDREALFVEKEADFRSDQARRAGHENDLFARHQAITTSSEEM